LPFRGFLKVDFAGCADKAAAVEVGGVCRKYALVVRINIVSMNFACRAGLR